jgi:RNA polymerase sigma factor (sigma-70 family)
MSDKEIINLLREGKNHQALQKLYEGFPPIRHFILQFGGSEEDVKDVFQEALIIFYQKAQNLDFVLTAKINTYLFSVSKYVWKDKLKAKNKWKYSDLDFASDEPIDFEQEGVDEIKMLDSVLIKLGDKCQAILQAYYILKLSMQEIASQFGYRNTESAKNQKYKCLEKAKQYAKIELLSQSKLA